MTNFHDFLVGNKDYRASYYCRKDFGTCTSLKRSLHLLTHIQKLFSNFIFGFLI